MKKKIYMCEFNLMMGESVYLPIATSSLVAYAKKNEKIRDNYQFMPYIFIKDSIDKIISSINAPFIVGFSISMWNYEFSLKLAKKIKMKYPDCIILCGGPSVPFSAEFFLKENWFIDFTCRGEGELIFTEILLELLKEPEQRNIKKIDGISYRHNEQCICNEQNHALMNLDEYVSPYLSGEFDYLLNNDRAYTYQVIVETNRGCPFSCGYCFWGMNGLSTKMRYFPIELVYETIRWLGKNQVAYIFCADSNFGIIERDVQIAKYLEETKKEYGYPEKFRVCFAKNSLERVREIGEIFARSALSKSTTVSFQSRNLLALKNIKRANISIEEFDEFIISCNEKKIPTYTEFILGFPGETTESFFNGIREVIDVNLHNEIFVYMCSVLPNTYIASESFIKEFDIKKKRIPLNEIHCNIHNDDEDYVQEFEEIITANSTMSETEMVNVMSKLAMFQLLYSLQLCDRIMQYLYNAVGFDIFDFVRFIVDTENIDGIEWDRNILRINAKECLKCYENIYIEGNGRGVYAAQYGMIYWEVEEKCFLDDITAERERLENDMKNVFLYYLKSKQIEIDVELLYDLIHYQMALLPEFCMIEKEVRLQYNWKEYYENGLDEPNYFAKSYVKISQVGGVTNDLEQFAQKTVLWGRKGGILFNILA